MSSPPCPYAQIPLMYAFPERIWNASEMTNYSGTDNLEAMAQATNYNDFLTQQVLSFSPPQGRILDFGAGIGTFSKYVSARGHDVACLEPDSVLASRLRSDGLTTYESMNEIADASLDYVFTLDVLEHIQDDAEAARAIASKLKPGGRLLVYVPAFPVLYSSMDKKVGHFRRYRRRRLQQLIAGAGFTDIRVRYVDAIGFFASLAYRITDDGTGGINVRMLKFYDRFLFPLSRLLNPLFARFLGKNIMLTAYRQNLAVSDRPSVSAVDS